MKAMTAPTLRTERRILREGYTLLAAGDEVGRGALCGPVSIGMVVVSLDTPPAPDGVRDSKLIAATARRRLVPLIRQWAVAHAVGHASAAEIDRLGIIAALRLAGHRALAELAARPAVGAPEVVLLDGHHDYLTAPAQADLFETTLPTDDANLGGGLGAIMPPVRTVVKGDLTCSAIAAASILAKVERDAIMADLARGFPQYGWESNCGYAAPVHVAALEQHGPTPHHRRSWRLPGVAGLSSEVAARPVDVAEGR